MTSLAHCTRCGTPVAEVSSHGLCSRCLLERGVGADGIEDATTLAELADSTGEESGTAEDERIGAYRLVRLLGEGGMGRVYLAEQEHPIRRLVALKVIKLGMDTRHVVSRFEAERQSLAILNHPGVAKIFDAGATPEGRPYFVMEHVAGVPITAYCDARRLSIAERLRLFVRVCGAIQHAHQKGIIHRDIKPSNVLVSDEDGDPVPKVIDFGIARATRDDGTGKTALTEQGQLIGTPSYMSPEQAGMGLEDIDTRTDVYSLGVLLYQLLVGVLPFDSKTARQAGIVEMLRIIQDEEPTPLTKQLVTMGERGSIVAEGRSTDLRSLSRELRGDLSWITAKAVEKDHERRYASCSELAADVERYLRDEPVVASPPSLQYRTRKFVRRNKIAVAGALAVVAALTVGLIATTAMYIRAEDRRIEAEWRSYLANISSANSSLLANDVPEAKRWLDLADPRLRGLEWRHLQAKADSSVATIPLPGRLVTNVVYSTDGTKIFGWSDPRIAQGSRYEVRIWDADTLRLESSHDLRTAEDLRSQAIVAVLAVSGDCARAVVRSAPSIGSDRMEQAGGSPAGARVDRSGVAPEIRLVELESGALIARLEGHDKLDVAAAFDPTGTLLVTTLNPASGRQPRVWSATDGRALEPLEPVVSEEAFYIPLYATVSFSGDGKQVGVRSRSENTDRLHVWDTASRRLVGSIELEENGAGLSSEFGFHPQGHEVALGLSDGTILVWEPGSAASPQVLRGHTPDTDVFAVAYLGDGSRLVSASSDGTLRLWDLASGQDIATFHGHDAAVFAVDVSPEGDRLVTTSADRTMRIWDPRSGGGFRLVGAGSALRHLALDADGSRVASGSAAPGTNQVSSWGLRSGAELWSSEPRDGLVTALAYNPAGDRLVSGGGGVVIRYSPGSIEREIIVQDTSLRVWDPVTGALMMTLEGHEGGVTAASFSPDGALIFSGSSDETMLVWDATSGDVLETLAVGADGSWPSVIVAGLELLVVGLENGDVQLLDAESYELIRVLHGHEAEVESAAFSPDERFLATAAHDDSVRVWNLDTGESKVVLASNNAGFVTFSGDGTRLLAGGGDGSLRVWDTARFDVVILLRTPATQVIAWASATDRADPPGTHLALSAVDDLIRLIEFSAAGGPTGTGGSSGR